MKKIISIFLLTSLLFCMLISCINVSDDSDGKIYSFVYNGATLTPGEPFDQVKKILGEPNNYYESASCAFEGIDKIYTYGSVQITVSEYGDRGDCIFSVFLLDDANTTPEGLTIGSDKAAVVEALGDGIDNGASLIYTGGNTQLVFLVRENTVTSVQYRFVE